MALMDINRILDDYRNHTILLAKRRGKFCGRVWKKKILLHETEGSSVEKTLGMLKKFVDQELEGAGRAAGNRPEETRVTTGLREICPELSAGQLAMLKAHYHAGNQSVTVTELANAAGYASYQKANLDYGRIGMSLYELAPIELPTYRDGTPIYICYLAIAQTDADDAPHCIWKLRPELASAIAALGLHA